MQPLLAEEPAFTYFTAEQIAALNPQAIPQHVAIVMDGNRRWAVRRNQSHAQGHREGADILLDIVRAAKELAIPYITVYGFSTENWNRSPEEVAALLWLMEQYAIEQRPNMIAHGVRVKCIGDLSYFPETLQQALHETCRASQCCEAIELTLALNYGSRNEICRAVNNIIEDICTHKLPKNRITEKLISQYLDTHGQPELDLFIRPGGEMRLSNFLSWQASYAELYFTDKLWPEFSPADLYQAVVTYQHRQRRIGV